MKSLRHINPWGLASVALLLALCCIDIIKGSGIPTALLASMGGGVLWP